MIFVISSERDEPTAEALEGFLKSCIEMPPGAVVRSHTSAGCDYAQLSAAVRQGIEDSDAVLAVVSPEPIACRRAMFELGAAWAMGRMIFIFFMPGIDFREAPEILLNFPNVELGSSDAHVALMDSAREISEYLGLKMRRNARPLDAIEALVSAARDGGEPEAEEDLAEEPAEDEYGFGTPSGAYGLNGPVEDEYCSITCLYEEAVLGSPTPGRVTVRAPWDELFKSLGAYLNVPQDEDYIGKLVVEFCKDHDTKFSQNCQFGMYKKPAADSYSLRRVIEHFAALGWIEKAKPARTAFSQKTSNRAYWRMTEKGGAQMRSIVSKQRTLQHWNGTELHLPRGVVREPKK